MPAFWPILVTGVHLTLAVEGMPNLDVGPTCRAAAAAETGAAGDAETCRQQERRARDELERAWDQHAAAQRERCNALERMGGSPSYVALLTCLEMAKTAKTLPDTQPDGQLDDIIRR